MLFAAAGAALGVTNDVTWALGTSETLTAEVGDVINFNWNQAIIHNVRWSPALFVQSTNNADATHVETYTIPAGASGQFYTIICGIHPSMQLLLTVAGDDGTAGPTVSPTNFPTDSPTRSPTRSPIGTNETHAPTGSPTLSPSDSPTSSPTGTPTALPTVQVVTVTSESEGMTTVVIVGIIIASIGLIGAVGVGGWSYLRYKRGTARTQPMQIEASSTARYRMSNF